MARQCVEKAQRKQKKNYDQHCRSPSFVVGERVFLYKLSVRTGEARKLARPFHGPYRIVLLDTNTAQIRHIDRPQDETILVVLSRLRRCPEEVPDECWPPLPKRGWTGQKRSILFDVPPWEPPTSSNKTGATPSDAQHEKPPSPGVEQEETQSSKWAGRLRERILHQPGTQPGTSELGKGEM